MCDNEGQDSGTLDQGAITEPERPSPSLPSLASVESPSVTPAKDISRSGSAKQKASSPKVVILLKPVGDAPIMEKKKWTVDRSKRISWVSEFIKKFIKTDSSESLFLYVNQAFAPSPDTEIGSIFDCFGSDGKLVLHYCRTQAWG